MKTLMMALALVLLAMSSAPAGAADDVVVGRVAFVESCGGWVMVDFPFGRRQLAPGQRDVDRYVFYQGKEMVFDRDLRPQWDAPVPTPSASARPR
jgi:hypothetical protein